MIEGKPKKNPYRKPQVALFWIGLILITILFLAIPIVSAIELNPFATVKSVEKTPTTDMSNFIKEDFNSKYGVIRLSNTFLWIETDKVAEYSLTKNTEFCFINCEAEGKVTLYSDGILFNDVKFKTLTGLDTSIQNSEYLILTDIKDNYVDVPDTTKEVCVDNEIVKGTRNCHTEVLTYKKVNQPIETWEKYTGEELKAGDYRWKIKGKKEATQSVDFIPIRNNKEFSEWATWNSSFENKLTAWWTSSTGTGDYYEDIAYVYGITSINHTGYLEPGAPAPTWVASPFAGKYGISTTGGTGVKNTVSLVNSSGIMGDGLTVSMGCWVFPSEDKDYNAFMGGIGGGYFGIALNQLAMTFLDGAGRWTAGGSIPIATWSFAGLSIDNGELTFYTNGLANGTASSRFWTNAEQPFVLMHLPGEYSFNGNVSECFSYNRSLSATEWSDLYNDRNGIFPTLPLISHPITVKTTLISPVNYYNTSNQEITFTANATSSYANLTNMTLWIWDKDGNVYSQSDTNLTANGTYAQTTIIKTIASGMYNWTFRSCAVNNTGYKCNVDVNRTFNLTLTSPIVTLNIPINSYNTTNPSIVFNCSADDDLGVVNITLFLNNVIQQTNLNTTSSENLSLKKTIGLTSEGNYTWTCKATDNNNQVSWATANRTISFELFNLTKTSYIFNTSTYEYSNESYLVNITYNPAVSLNYATLVYNGISYSTTMYGGNGNARFYRQLDIPSLTSPQNRSFYWAFNYNYSTILTNGTRSSNLS